MKQVLFHVFVDKIINHLLTYYNFYFNRIFNNSWCLLRDTDDSKIDYSKLKITEEGKFSITKRRDAERIINIIKSAIKDLNIIYIRLIHLMHQ